MRRHSLINGATTQGLGRFLPQYIYRSVNAHARTSKYSMFVCVLASATMRSSKSLKGKINSLHCWRQRSSKLSKKPQQQQQQ